MDEVEFTLLSVDPGWSTGWAMLTVEGGEVRLSKQGTIEGGVDGWLSHGSDMGDMAYFGTIVCEDFIVEPAYVGRAWSSEVIGALKAKIAFENVILQSRSDKATLFTQKHTGDKGETERFAWLRERGFSGTPHELDAITHALVYLKRQRNRAALKQYWGI